MVQLQDKKKLVKAIEIQGKHKQEFGYDHLGRLTAVNEYIDGRTWTKRMKYNLFGKVSKETFPSGYYVQNSYNQHGYLMEVSDGAGRSIWKYVNENARGQFLKVQRGNKTTVLRYGDRGLPTSITADGVQNMTFSFNSKGNLEYRYDFINGQYEVFAYDSNNRLTNWMANNDNLDVRYHSITYNATNNIETKTDIASGKLIYGENGKPNALTSINLPNSSMITTGDLSVTYTDFKKIKTLKQGNKHYELTYGVDDQRRKSIFKKMVR